MIGSPCVIPAFQGTECCYGTCAVTTVTRNIVVALNKTKKKHTNFVLEAHNSCTVLRSEETCVKSYRREASRLSLWQKRRQLGQPRKDKSRQFRGPWRSGFYGLGLSTWPGFYGRSPINPPTKIPWPKFRGSECLHGADEGAAALPGLDSGTVAIPGLDLGTCALSGLDGGMQALPGLDGGTECSRDTLRAKHNTGSRGSQWARQNAACSFLLTV